MSGTLSVLACEGRHDAALLAAALQALGWARHKVSDSDPELIQSLVARKIQTRPGSSIPFLDALPTILARGEQWTMIQFFEGLEGLLRNTRPVVEQIGRRHVHTLAVFVDANGVGVATRESAVRARLSEWTHNEIRAGAVVPGHPSHPRVGLWVSPNNTDPGSIDDLLLQCASARSPDLVPTIDELVARLALPSVSEQKKAKLGMFAQRDAPGAGVAAAVTRCGEDWVAGAPLGPLADLCTFLQSVTEHV